MVSPNFVRGVGYVGAVCNWLIPAAAISNFQKPADTINPGMNAALWTYSIFFTRWAIAISPPNWPLMLCHVTNQAAQSGTLVRYAHYRATKAN